LTGEEVLLQQILIHIMMLLLDGNSIL